MSFIEETQINQLPKETPTENYELTSSLSSMGDFVPCAEEFREAQYGYSGKSSLAACSFFEALTVNGASIAILEYCGLKPSKRACLTAASTFMVGAVTLMDKHISCGNDYKKALEKLEQCKRENKGSFQTTNTETSFFYGTAFPGQNTRLYSRCEEWVEASTSAGQYVTFCSKIKYVLH